MSHRIRAQARYKRTTGEALMLGCMTCRATATAEYLRHAWSRL
ncbi:hypothetical protein [Paenibacillus sp. TY11]